MQLYMKLVVAEPNVTFRASPSSVHLEDEAVLPAHNWPHQDTVQLLVILLGLS